MPLGYTERTDDNNIMNVIFDPNLGVLNVNDIDTSSVITAQTIVIESQTEEIVSAITDTNNILLSIDSNIDSSTLLLDSTLNKINDNTLDANQLLASINTNTTLLSTNLQVLTSNLLLCNYNQQPGGTAYENYNLCSQLVTGTMVNAIPYPNPILVYTASTFGIIDNTSKTDIVLGEYTNKVNDLIDNEYLPYNSNLNFAMSMPHLLFFSGDGMENTTYISNKYYEQFPNIMYYPKNLKTSNIIELRIPFYMRKIKNVDLSNNSLSQITIEHILTHLDINGIKRGNVNLKGNANINNMTANANTAKANLILKGWKIII